jgi:serpin B
LIYTPATFSKNSHPGGEKKCFSQKLNPSYPCCERDFVVYVDKDGEWGVENGKWCGIGGVIDSCFSVALGYPCCESSCNVYYTDKDGEWGVENENWCGIKDNCKNPIKEDPVIVNNNTTDTSINDFEFTFLKMDNNKKNMLYSPLSIVYALIMLLVGANGYTYDVLNKII